MSTDAVISCELLHIDNYCDEVSKTCLMEHGSFGLTRRTGGVDHVGETVGLGEVDGSVGEEAIPEFLLY